MRAHDQTDPLARERGHLDASRSALRAMRADAEALDIRDVTANWVNAAVLERQIEDRIKSLADLAHTPLFFGRLDFSDAGDVRGVDGRRPPTPPQIEPDSSAGPAFDALFAHGGGLTPERVLSLVDGAYRGT